MLLSQNPQLALSSWALKHGQQLAGQQIRSILTLGSNSHAKPLVPNLMVILKVSLSLWSAELLLALSTSSP